MRCPSKRLILTRPVRGQRRTALLLSAVALMLIPVPAQAHQSLNERSGNVSCTSLQTTSGNAALDHSFETIQVTAGPAGCFPNYNPQVLGPNGYQLGGLFYHDGVGPCYGTGQITNSVSASSLQWRSFRDVFFDGCNRGLGVNTYITMDTWFYSFNGAYFQSGNWRPAVGHCHCP